MQQNRFFEVISWVRVLAFTASLYFLLKSASFTSVIETNILADISSSFLLLGAFCIASLVPAKTFKLCLNLWNKVTPLKDKPTFIETEIVYLLSIVPTTSVILLVLLKAPLASLIALIGLVFAAALPTVILCYLACRFFLKSAAEIAEMKAELAEGEAETVIEALPEHGILESPTNTLIPFLLAALIFAVTVSLMTTITILMRGGGFQPKVFTSVMSLSAVTIVLLTIFGQSALNFGASIQKRLGVSPFTSRRGIASAWSLGIMISMTGFVLLFSGHRLPTSLEGWMASWHFVVAYMIISLSCFLSGIFLSLFYKKKPISGVFT